MKYIFVVFFIAGSFILGNPPKQDIHPWIAEKHTPDERGYLHGLPCHGGETAAVVFEDEEKSGCYILDWRQTHAKDIDSGKCYVDVQNVLICKE